MLGGWVPPALFFLCRECVKLQWQLRQKMQSKFAQILILALDLATRDAR